MSWLKKLFGKTDSSAAHRAQAPASDPSTPAPSTAATAAAPATGAAEASAAVVRAGAPRIAVVTGSTRPGRNNRQVAEWLVARATQRGDASFELVDIADFSLPLLDEAYPAAYGNYAGEHTKAWAAKIAEFDGYVFVTPEYNHSTAPALANALSFLNAEWANKAAGIVGYGSAMGARAVEHLRGVLSELQVAHVQKTGMFSLFSDFEDFSVFKPTDLQAASVDPMLDQLVSWSAAFAQVRAGELEGAAV
ncbi:NADPH-dependent FMN reductase [Sinomonas atrocyanea]|uniref:NADPH-dependent FMN reductase n=1 Tax=Sinomonas atrocyanea TaxID=37927 RepID=UPI00277FCDFB|nr:NAD(P)H-dependent oxidoreductase [Sinomonas atrocyanea]MDQ0261580.1 NAD(P)H-dependent FMN reductase [Sinomonas atrocyanea]MDR6623280.1 NAD(P)H-dependent FMN reductase [Sinomonas atrocyanea]